MFILKECADIFSLAVRESVAAVSVVVGHRSAKHGWRRENRREKARMFLCRWTT